VLAAVTRGPHAIELIDVPDPAPPGPGQVLLRPEVVGICGSDLHLLAGELDVVGHPTLPRVQGHELSAIVEAVGEGVDLTPGTRVAMWPLRPCGDCYPCSVGRPNVCDAFELVGIHVDGGLAQLLRVPAAQLFPIDVDDPEVAALVEPTSIAVRAISRAGVRPGEPVVVLGAGPIGQLCTLAALDAGARVLTIDPLPARLDYARALGADAQPWTDRATVVAAAQGWAGDAGVPCVIDATGNPDAIGAAFDMAASAGRIAIVGMSGAELRVPVVAFVAKELDVVGVSVCTAEEFGRAVSLIERHQDEAKTLISHRFAFAQTPEALAFAMDHPTEVMKVVIGV
jgi:threonine dehydrogenase-like Zn-dependent dehydrogenase